MNVADWLMLGMLGAVTLGVIVFVICLTFATIQEFRA